MWQQEVEVFVCVGELSLLGALFWGGLFCFVKGVGASTQAQ